uniref:Uncharacterized protein n=1 Tax=Aetherobacter fasciculatus TaxID=888830 RepID=A0A3Q8I1K3_9BACT|nr:hypothetical protein [Aetherobacter fasciculatus]
MNTWNTTAALRQSLLACALLASLAGALGCNSAFADEKRPYPKGGSSAAPAAGPSASAAPPEPEPDLVDGHKPWAPTLDVVLPEAASAAPTKVEWASAPRAWEVRITDPGCKAWRIREWYRFSCGFGEIEMISGSNENVSFTCAKTQQDSELCSEAAIIFPVRRGDRRAVEFLAWSKWGPEPDSILTEQFLEGDPYPMISLQGLRWDF